MFLFIKKLTKYFRAAVPLSSVVVEKREEERWHSARRRGGGGEMQFIYLMYWSVWVLDQ